MNDQPLPDRLAPVVPRALPVQSRPVRKQMIATLKAAAVLLDTERKEAVRGAIEVLAKLSDTDLAHAKVWLAKPEAGAGGLHEDLVDKLVSLIESLERVRPRMVAQVNAAKVTGALKGLAEQGQQELKPEDVAKLKAQTEN